VDRHNKIARTHHGLAVCLRSGCGSRHCRRAATATESAAFELFRREKRERPNGDGSKNLRLVRPLVVTARCPNLRVIRACAQSSCCLLLDTQWQTWSGSLRTCQSKLGGAAEIGCAALVACPSKSFREHLASAMRGRDRSPRHAATQAVSGCFLRFDLLFASMTSPRGYSPRCLAGCLGNPGKLSQPAQVGYHRSIVGLGEHRTRPTFGGRAC